MEMESPSSVDVNNTKCTIIRMEPTNLIKNPKQDMHLNHGSNSAIQSNPYFIRLRQLKEMKARIYKLNQEIMALHVIMSEKKSPGTELYETERLVEHQKRKELEKLLKKYNKATIELKLELTQ